MAPTGLYAPQPSTAQMNTSHPYDLVIGLDRSDKKADLHLITTATGQRRSQTIDTAFHISGLLGGKIVISHGVLTCSTFPSASRTLKTTRVAFVDLTKTLPSAFVVTEATSQTPF